MQKCRECLTNASDKTLHSRQLLPGYGIHKITLQKHSTTCCSSKYIPDIGHPTLEIATIIVGVSTVRSHPIRDALRFCLLSFVSDIRTRSNFHHINYFAIRGSLLFRQLLSKKSHQFVPSRYRKGYIRYACSNGASAVFSRVSGESCC